MNAQQPGKSELLSALTRKRRSARALRRPTISIDGHVAPPGQVQRRWRLWCCRASYLLFQGGSQILRHIIDGAELAELQRAHISDNRPAILRP